MNADVVQFIPRSGGSRSVHHSSAQVVALPLPKVKLPTKCGEPISSIASRFKNEAGLPVTDLEVADWCKRVGWHVLTANQRSFIDTILTTLHQRPLSDAQGEWLVGLVDKINRRCFGGAA